MRVFFDASVIIAAILSQTGGSSLLLKYVKVGKISGITSQTVVDEVLNKSIKLNKTKETLESFISQCGLVVRNKITSEDISPYLGLVDDEDAHVIAGAKLTKCSHLVTLDKKDLLNAQVKNNFSPLKIVSPKDLLEEIVSA